VVSTNSLGYLTYPAHNPGIYAIKLRGKKESNTSWADTTYDIRGSQMRLTLLPKILTGPKNYSGTRKDVYLIIDSVRIFACTNKAKENLFRTMLGPPLLRSSVYDPNMDTLASGVVNSGNYGPDNALSGSSGHLFAPNGATVNPYNFFSYLNPNQMGQIGSALMHTSTTYTSSAIYSPSTTPNDGAGIPTGTWNAFFPQASYDF
jgi:hypothetical protein